MSFARLGLFVLFGLLASLALAAPKGLIALFSQGLNEPPHGSLAEPSAEEVLVLDADTSGVDYVNVKVGALQAERPPNRDYGPPELHPMAAIHASAVSSSPQDGVELPIASAGSSSSSGPAPDNPIIAPLVSSSAGQPAQFILPSDDVFNPDWTDSTALLHAAREWARRSHVRIGYFGSTWRHGDWECVTGRCVMHSECKQGKGRVYTFKGFWKVSPALDGGEITEFSLRATWKGDHDGSDVKQRSERAGSCTLVEKMNVEDEFEKLKALGPVRPMDIVQELEVSEKGCPESSSLRGIVRRLRAKHGLFGSGGRHQLLTWSADLDALA